MNGSRIDAVSGRGGCDRKTVVEVVQFIPDDPQGIELSRSVAENGQAHSSKTELPVDVESVGE